jgi:AcrR family transcriptional regulator
MAAPQSDAAVEHARAGTRRPGRPRNEQTEQAILQAAIEILAEHGYNGLTVEAVALRAGVAKTTVYRRWAGKDELLLDALNTIKGPITEAPGGAVRDDLRFVYEQMRLNWRNGNHGVIMRQLAADGSERPDLYREFRDRVVKPRQAVTRAILERGVAEGLIRPDVDLDAVIEMLASPVIVAVMTHRPHPTRRQVEFVIDTVLAGISP